MGIRSSTVPLSIVAIISACNGEVRSRLLTPDQLQAELSKPEGIRGVFGYYDKDVIEVDQLTQLTDASGKPTGGSCNPVNVQKVVTYADQDHPIQIWYDYGLLEAHQFSVQLSSSVFTNVNSTSTPDQGKTLANLGSAATSFAKVAAPATAPPPGRPTPQVNCNATPYLVEFRPLHLP
jgi:hypothetical protein